jgi:hypothetical protein
MGDPECELAPHLLWAAMTNNYHLAFTFPMNRDQDMHE